MNLTDKYTKKTIQTPSSKNMTAIIIGGHTRSNGWTRCGAGMARMACEYAAFNALVRRSASSRNSGASADI
jgi:hypothetical protein